jgi:L-ascorbate metabolism protein UlaG (beta-lactamase superfamily)
MFLSHFQSEWINKPHIDAPSLQIHYLGTAGFVLSGHQHHVVIDPFLTRPGILKTGFSKLRSNTSLLEEIIPKANDVLIGHSHHDHILDAPNLCLQTGARFIGSPDSANVARAAGLDEKQIRTTIGREDIECGDGFVRGIPSQHGRVYLNRVTLPGRIDKPPPWPPNVWHLKHGLVLNWLIELAGKRVMHIDSADFIPSECEGIEVDVLCLCSIGRRYRPNYVAEAVSIFKPKWVIPCHWDWFFVPYMGKHKMLPGVDLLGMVEEIKAAGAQPAVLPIDGRWSV